MPIAPTSLCVLGQTKVYQYQYIQLNTVEGNLFLGGLRVTNPSIRLMCPTSVCLSTFSFLDSNSKMLYPIEFKLDREIDHLHS